VIIRHSIIYLAAKLIPALLGLASIGIYTRFLDAEQYGHFAIIFSVAGITYGLIYAWLWLGLSRFIPLYRGREQFLQAVVLRSYLVLSLAGGLAGAALATLWPDSATRPMVWLAVPLCCLMGWYEINQELNRARLLPLGYTQFSIMKSIITVIASTALAYMGFGAQGMVWGAIIGLLVPLMIFRRAGWSQAYRTIFRTDVLADMGRYGLTLSLSVMLVMVIFSADRLLLGWLLNAEMAGLYAIAYDLALKSIHTLTIAMDLAAFPIVVRALENSGIEAARRQLASNGTLLMTITFPASTGLFLLAEPIINFLVGEAFQESAIKVFPWILFAALMAGFSQAHFQHAFTLGRNTKLLAFIMGFVCLVNLALNAIFIPMHGILGAAYASFASFALLMVLNWAVGRRIFLVPIPWRNGAMILFASAAMGAILLLLEDARTPQALFGRITLGALVYGLLLMVLNPDGYRSRLLHWLGQKGVVPSRCGDE
jgi:O-antigen/teichoic acid export membrane protein